MRRKLTTCTVESKPSQKSSSGNETSRFITPNEYTSVDGMYACKPIVDSSTEDKQILAEIIESNVTFTLTPIGSIRRMPLNLLKKSLPTFIGFKSSDVLLSEIASIIITGTPVKLSENLIKLESRPCEFNCSEDAYVFIVYVCIDIRRTMVISDCRMISTVLIARVIK